MDCIIGYTKGKPLKDDIGMERSDEANKLDHLSHGTQVTYPIRVFFNKNVNIQ